jgi:hypothetical protein
MGQRFEAPGATSADGFDERFRRLWRFYLSYCEAGFRTERTNVIQLGLAENAGWLNIGPPTSVDNRASPRLSLSLRSCLMRLSKTGVARAARRTIYQRSEIAKARHDRPAHQRPRRHRQHAADPPEPGQRGDRLRDPRQGRVHEPRPVGQGPRRPGHHPRRRSASGLLRPGGRIVEGTAGNTGIGLAMVAKALGYKTTIVIPRTQSQEKKDAIRLLGAELVEVDAVPYSNPDNYVRYSGRLAEELAKTEPNGAIWANQFDNVANREAHYRTRARKSGNRQRVRSTASSAPSARAAPWPASPRPCASASPA